MTEYPSRRALRENPGLIWKAPANDDARADAARASSTPTGPAQVQRAVPSRPAQDTGQQEQSLPTWLDQPFDQDDAGAPASRYEVPQGFGGVPGYTVPTAFAPPANTPDPRSEYSPDFDAPAHQTREYDTPPFTSVPAAGPLQEQPQIPARVYDESFFQETPRRGSKYQPEQPGGFQHQEALHRTGQFESVRHPAADHSEPGFAAPAHEPAQFAPAVEDQQYGTPVMDSGIAPEPEHDRFRPHTAPQAAVGRQGLLAQAAAEYESNAYEPGMPVDGHGGYESAADAVQAGHQPPAAHSYEGHYDDGAVEHYEDDYLEVRPSRGSSRSQRVRKRRRSLVFLVVVLLFAAVVYFVVQSVKPMLAGFETPDYPGPGTGSVSFVVPDGATGRSIAADLKAEDVVESEQAFLDALTAADGASALQPGTFEMKHQMKAADAVAVLLAVDGNKVHYTAIAQNLRIGETLKVLADSTGLPLADFESLANQPTLFDLPPQAKNLEGYLAPGEYRFPIDIDAKGVLDELVKATKDELAATGITDPNEQYRILTVASIIEFEGNVENYAMISGAIENRINKPNAETGGRLESDATVAYGLGKKTYNITADEKADASNPYNTFANAGLPVGPIGSPGNKAVVAAAHPEANDYYFWVTVNLDTGETLYAATFAEHQANVAKYVAWCDANAGKCD